jgi:hypothetical protein
MNGAWRGPADVRGRNCAGWGGPCRLAGSPRPAGAAAPPQTGCGNAPSLRGSGPSRSRQQQPWWCSRSRWLWRLAGCCPAMQPPTLSTCSAQENGRQLKALAQQQRNNEGRHVAKQAGQLLPQGVWGKAWGGIKSALGRTAAQKRAAAEGPHAQGRRALVPLGVTDCHGGQEHARGGGAARRVAGGARRVAGQRGPAGWRGGMGPCRLAGLRGSTPGGGAAGRHAGWRGGALPGGGAAGGLAGRRAGHAGWRVGHRGTPGGGAAEQHALKCNWGS